MKYRNQCSCPCHEDKSFKHLVSYCCQPDLMVLSMADLQYLQKYFEEHYKDQEYLKIYMKFEERLIILHRYTKNGGITYTSWDEYNIQLALNKRLT